MQSYILNFQRATAVATGLEHRGYRGEFREGLNGYVYKKKINDDLEVKLVFTKKGDTLGNVGLLVGSRNVNRLMHSLGLFINVPATPIEEHETVIAVDLIWLRLNHDPNRIAECKDDYKFGTEHGVQRFFEDLDTVGRDFINEVSEPHAMADLLSNLDKYPCRTHYGGKPVSVAPHVYAAIFYMHLGEKVRAKEVLDQGWREHQYPAPREYWQNVQLQAYQTRRLLMLRHMGMAGVGEE